MVHTIREVAVGFLTVGSFWFAVFVVCWLIFNFQKFFTYVLCAILMAGTLAAWFFLCRDVGRQVIIHLGW
jgi:hypothetical protein